MFSNLHIVSGRILMSAKDMVVGKNALENWEVFGQEYDFLRDGVPMGK